MIYLDPFHQLEIKVYGRLEIETNVWKRFDKKSSTKDQGFNVSLCRDLNSK